MPSLTIESVKTKLAEFNLTLTVNPKRKELHKYVVTDTTENAVFGADTLVNLMARFDDFLAAQPEIVEPEYTEVTYNMSDFEGIEWDVMAVTTWWACCPLTCDICDYQICRVPEKAPSYWDTWWQIYESVLQSLPTSVRALKAAQSHMVIFPLRTKPTSLALR